MTHIASYPSKKHFKEAALAGKAYVDDPSMFSPVSGRIDQVLDQKGEITVTNHPKRSWFARVYRKDGQIKVE